MPLPNLGIVFPVRPVDADGNPVAVNLVTGVFRLAVDAVITGGSTGGDIRNADNDDDFAAALLGQVTNSRLGHLDDISVYRRTRGGTGTDAGFATTLQGLLANARLGFFNVAAAAYARAVGADQFSAADENNLGLIVRATLCGQNAESPATSRSQVIAARNSDGDGDYADSLPGVVANARLGVLNEALSNYTRVSGLLDGIGAAYVLQPRQSGWPASRMGRRFVATHQTLGSTITAQTAFLATTPTFLMRQAASSRRIILRSIEIFQTNEPGNFTQVTVVLDTADRFSAGGVAHTPQNVNEESVVASALTAFLSNPTATAAGAGTRVVHNAVYDNAAFGGGVTIEFDDEIIMGTTSSLLVYVVDTGGTAPTVKFVFNWEEIP